MQTIITSQADKIVELPFSTGASKGVLLRDYKHSKAWLNSQAR